MRWVARFWSRVNVGAGPSSCWPWMAALDTSGRGSFRHTGKLRVAHRVAYELANGPIPDGLTVDHLCNNPVCCNPAHLQLLSKSDNLRRSWADGAHSLLRVATCKRGHALAGDNAYVPPKRPGRRYCRACMRFRKAA